MAFTTALGAQFKVDVLPEKLIEYRQHDENAIGMKRPEPQNFWTANGKRRQSQRSLALRLQRLLNDSSRLASIEPCWIKDLEQRRIHAHHRGHLSRNPLKRGGQVGREFFSGRYFKYAQGWRSVVSDLALLQ